MKILIADDSKMIRKRILKILSHYPGIDKITETEYADETLKEIQTQKPNVLLLDFQLPDGTGIDILNEVAEMDYIPTKIILTNYATEEHKTKCINSGADFFFDKSKEFMKVKDVFNHLITNQQ